MRQAALGIAVVPDVNWILTMSFGERFRDGRGFPSACRSDTMELYGVRHLKSEVLTRPEELSTKIMFWREGIIDDSSFGLVRSWIMCWRRGMLLRGSFRGRLDSALMIKWLAFRWLSAATTCIVLKERFIGT